MDFIRKACWVKDGHKTPTSTTSSFAVAVSRNNIRIGLTYVALLGLSVIGADIRNAYLQAPSSEKHFIVCGPEFGLKNEDRVALIRYTKEKLQVGFFDITSVTIWANLVLFLLVWIPTFGLGCQNNQQGRNCTNMSFVCR
jgi:hypothetical protein